MSLARVQVVLLCGILVLPTAPIWAQTTSPDPASAAMAAQLRPIEGLDPTSAPASTQPVPADPSSPRGTLKALVGAMQAGDVAKIKSLIATTNPTEEKMVDAMATMAVSQKKFRTAARTAYGDGATELVGNTEADAAAGLAKIDTAPETIDGDTATVDPNERPDIPPMTLKKIDGQWRIPISELARGVDPSAIQQRLDDLSLLSRMMDESADEVSKGMYKTPKDATEAINSKMMVAMMKRANAATQSTTQPAADGRMDAPATAPSAPGM